MKKIFFIILSFMMIVSSCDTVDFGDINKDVNGPEDPNTATLLSGAVTNFYTRRGRPYCITPTLYVQYFHQNVYTDEMLYADYAGFWSSYYVQTLSNLQEVVEICSVPEAATNAKLNAGGYYENQLAVALILKSVMFKRVTDNFGDVPYSEAFSAANFTPAYDSQESIYASMIQDVQDARDMISTSDLGPIGDVIYGGDMVMWQKFANSFLMQLALQVSDVTTSAIDAEAVFVDAVTHSAGALESASEDALFVPDVDAGYNNPWDWMRSADYGISMEFMSSLKGAGDNKVSSNTTYDDRINFITSSPSSTGHPYGFRTNTEGTSAGVNSTIISADTDLPILTAAYTWLNRAEAASLGWTTEDVATCLTNGIMQSYASMNSLYGGSYDGTAYAAARVADLGTVGELQVIAEEKWVALFPLGFDAWSEHRRTNYPVLTPATDALNDGSLPTRYNYPSDEVTLNPNGYSQGVNGLTPAADNNSSRVWWDVD